MSEEQARQSSLAAFQNYKSQMTAIDKRETDARLQLQQQHLTAVSGIFGNLAGAAQAFGKKGLAIYKALAISQTVIDTYAAAVAAYRSLAGIPVFGPGLAKVAAAAAIAFGLARVAAIKSITMAGSAHGGLDWVPQTGTYLLKAGEAVLQPARKQGVAGIPRQHEANGLRRAGTGSTVEFIG